MLSLVLFKDSVEKLVTLSDTLAVDCVMSPSTVDSTVADVIGISSVPLDIAVDIVVPTDVVVAAVVVSLSIVESGVLLEVLTAQLQ